MERRRAESGNATRKEISHNIRMSVSTAKSIIYLHFYFFLSFFRYYIYYFSAAHRPVLLFCTCNIQFASIVLSFPPSVAPSQRAIFASFVYLFLHFLSLGYCAMRCHCDRTANADAHLRATPSLRIVQDKEATTGQTRLHWVSQRNSFARHAISEQCMRSMDKAHSA